jgi:hypothetical protein
MTADEARALLRRSIAAELGEARAAELADAIGATAEALALVLSEPMALDGEDPDFCRPPAG